MWFSGEGMNGFLAPHLTRLQPCNWKGSVINI